MLKSKAKKLLTCCCAVALMAACAVPAFAASDGWTRCGHGAWRASGEMAVAKVSSPSNSESAAAFIDKLEGTNHLYLVVNEYSGGKAVSDVYYWRPVGRTVINYNYPVCRNFKLQLKGGNDEPSNNMAYSWGTCNFG